MSNPYTSPSISGFNSSPPPDDGTEVASNQLDWDNHIDKIGNPLKNYAAAIDAAASSAHGLAFGAAVLAKTADYTVTTADRGRFITVTGTSTITLPAAADAGEGFPLLITNIGTAIVTVDADSSETINGNTTITLFAGEYIILTCNATSWSGAGVFSIIGSFTPTFAGFSVDPDSPVVNYRVTNNIAHLWFKFTTGTSNSTSFSIANTPAVIRPTDALRLAIPNLQDNGIDGWGSVTIQNGSSMAFRFQSITAASWTASGDKGFGISGSYIQYPLRMT